MAVLRDVLTDTGALKEAEQLIDELTQSALAALRVASITEEARTALTDLAIAATERRV